MDRRQFVTSSLALLTTAAWGGAADKLLALNKVSELKRQPWAIGFLGAEPSPLKKMTVTGTFPLALEGCLYRNGPAKMSRAGLDYQHWFDGDGMVQKFTIKDGEVSHQSEFIKTEKYLAEEQAGKFLFNSAGTVIPNSRGIGNNDDINTANTSLLPRNGQLLALWEAGSPHMIDPDKLSTQGIKSFGEKFTGLPFSAHPLADGAGGLWNFGCWYVGGNKTLLVYQVDSDDNVSRLASIELPQAGYIHGFAQSQNKLVFYIPPCVYQRGNTYIDSFTWQQGLGSKLLIIDKADFEKRQYVDLPAGFVFHFGQAFEEGNQLWVELSLYSNADILTQGMKALLEGDKAEMSPDAQWVRISIELESTTASTTEFVASNGEDLSPQRVKEAQISYSGIKMEFPQFDQSGHGMRLSKATYGVGASALSLSGLSDTLYRVASQPEQAVQSYHLGANIIAEEALFIATHDDTEGYLVMTWLDYGKQVSGLSVFDASKITQGPIATAKLDTVIPLGFHGCFIKG